MSDAQIEKPIADDAPAAGGDSDLTESTVEPAHANISDNASRILEPFAIDPRSLAALRIGCGIVTLYDLAVRSTNLNFYTDLGVCPREVYLQGGSGWQTVYALTGSTAGVAALFVLHALFAAGLIIGWRTRLMTAGCLVMTWSLINRNLMVVTGGDQLLAWLLIWSLFLPTGMTASVDALAAGAERVRTVASRTPVRSVASAALLLQVVIVYLVAMAARTNRDWWIDLSAVHYIANSIFATPLGQQLAHRPVITILMTLGAVYLELAGPIVALLSWRAPRVRTLVIAAFILLHVGMGMTIYVGSFALVCIVAWLAFVPRETWDWIFATAPGRALARGWDTLLERIARVLPAGAGRAAPTVEKSRVPGRARRAGIVVAAALLAYVMVVNLASVLPARLVGPVARMPKFKQNWRLLDQPEHVDQRISMAANLADGSERVIASSVVKPTGRRELLWPSVDSRDRKFWHSLWVLPRNQLSAGGARQYDAFRVHWDRTHPPEQRIVQFRVIWQSLEIPPVDLADRPGVTREQVTHLVYLWPSQPTQAQ